MYVPLVTNVLKFQSDICGGFVVMGRSPFNDSLSNWYQVRKVILQIKKPSHCSCLS